MSSPILAADWLPLWEAIHAVEQSREAWLHGITRSALSLAEPDSGVGGLLYEASASCPFRLDHITGARLPEGWLEAGMEMHTHPALQASVRHSYRHFTCASSNEFLAGSAAPQAHAHQSMAHSGVAESFCINGLDPSGFGCAIYLFSRTGIALHPDVLVLLQRIASHLATAYRLQRRLAGADGTPVHVEAVLGPDGRLLHAEGEARDPAARASLRRAVENHQRAHGGHERRPAGSAFETMACLTDARWSLRERIDSDSKRQIEAVTNAPTTIGPRMLSTRERQVVALATLGRSNKLIAYELGLAHSTVRVLLARAAAKLGVRTRRELIQVMDPGSAE